jgi:histidyl-tRNA synthetase
MGSSELEGGIVKIKDLMSREETTVSLDNFTDYFTK